MRIHLSLQHDKKQIIPIDYRYYLSAWIYKTIYRSNQEFASWLHDKGYDIGSKRFKLFCYSDIRQPGTQLTRDKSGIVFSGREADWTLSFYVDEAVRHFVKGVFIDQELEIAGHGLKASFKINSVEILPHPEFSEEMTYRTLSPIMVKRYRPEDSGVDHIGPMDEGYADLIRDNLLAKYAAYHGKAYAGNREIKIDLAPGRISTKKHNVYKPGKKPIENKGYHFSFCLKGSVELQKVGYYSGFGNSNSGLGYGMVEVKNSIPIKPIC